MDTAGMLARLCEGGAEAELYSGSFDTLEVRFTAGEIKNATTPMNSVMTKCCTACGRRIRSNFSKNPGGPLTHMTQLKSNATSNGRRSQLVSKSE